MPDNVRRGRPQGKCHRERTACAAARVRVKRCGKSAPRLRRRRWQGKPHREQNRIGTASRTVRSSSDNSAGHVWLDRSGRLLEATRKRCPRGMAVTYRARKRAVPYKTRLTGRLMLLRNASRVLNEGLGANHAGPFARLGLDLFTVSAKCLVLRGMKLSMTKSASRLAMSASLALSLQWTRDRRPRQTPHEPRHDFGLYREKDCLCPFDCSLRDRFVVFFYGQLGNRIAHKLWIQLFNPRKCLRHLQAIGTQLFNNCI